jgi:hypothetical protein
MLYGWTRQTSEPGTVSRIPVLLVAFQSQYVVVLETRLGALSCIPVAVTLFRVPKGRTAPHSQLLALPITTRAQLDRHDFQRDDWRYSPQNEKRELAQFRMRLDRGNI